jgi:hypothetical protein
MLIDPLVGANVPVIIFMVVVLPAPFGPSKPMIWPRRNSSEMSSTASLPP